jgi:hypothetical protein
MPHVSRQSGIEEQGVFVGTSSWKYPGWRGMLYDPARYEYRGKFAETRFERGCLFDITNMTFVGSITVSNIIGSPTSFCRWGTDGLAFGTSGGQVFLIRTFLRMTGTTTFCRTHGAKALWYARCTRSWAR